MPELVFLSERLPLLGKVAQWIAASAPGEPLDLRSAAVIVSTAGAARRLKGELVRLAADRQTGLLPPLLVSPMAFLDNAGPGDSASRVDRLLAWCDVVGKARSEDFPRLLEGFADHSRPAVALRIAQSLTEVCTLLSEAGWTLASPEVALRAQDEERWKELAELYRRYLERLGRADLRDPEEARIAAAILGRAPEGIFHVIVAGVPDLNRLLQRYLENLETNGVRVTVLVDAPDCAEARFDAWGRPEAEYWNAAELPLSLTDVHVLGDPASEAEVVARLLGGAALCVADPNLVPFHERALRGAGLEPFNPSGKSLDRFECGALVGLWLEFCRAPELSTLRALFEQPSFLDLICGESKLPPSAALRVLDKIRTGALVELLADALMRFPTDAEGALMQAVDRLRTRFDVAQSLDKFPAFLGRVYERRTVSTELAEALPSLAGVLDAVLGSPLGSGRASAELLAGEIAASSVYGRHEDAAVELNGWLEASWLAHRALVISGCTEGSIPANVTGHPFLPDTLRASLGLQTNAQRYTRDIYLMHALLASREPGMVKLTLSRISGEGDPARPSRLLFRCDEAELRDRVKFVLGPVPAYRVAAPREPLWKLDIPKKDPPTKLRVTAFGEYLACPFRFYLSRIVKMDPFDPFKAEMDARDFGTALHQVVEDFARSEVKDARDVETIEKFVLADLDRVLMQLHGVKPSLPVRVQKESLRARLRQFARLQAANRREGWRIVDAEMDFTLETPLTLGGLPISARIDRVDLHEETGQRRILDYKTYKSVRGNLPSETHMEPSMEDFPEAEFTWDGRQRRWKQLQLPLYRALAMRSWPDDPAPPAVGYFLLPEKLEESCIVDFEIDEPLFESAMRCAEAVADRVRRGVFWPPRDVKYDDFAEMFPDGVAEALDSGIVGFLKGTPTPALVAVP